jgi:hypothetical protein
MKTLANLLWLMALTPPLLVGLAIGFIGLILEKEERYV